MSDTGMTTLEVRKINKQKIYSLIYSAHTISKQGIASQLSMSLTTVTLNLKILEEEGLIERKGTYQSTGGRKAMAIRICPEARIAIGIDILKDRIHFAAVNLYGQTIHSHTEFTHFTRQAFYFENLGRMLTVFLSELAVPAQAILGVGIAVQGITTPAKDAVNYGPLLNCTGMKCSDFSEYIPFPCHLEHDSKAAAALELFTHPDLKDGIVLLLNRNLGGAVITNGKIHEGIGVHSGALEHICIDPHGPRCYCGQRGCLETYCSAEGLENAAGEPLTGFFAELRKGDARRTAIWNRYLETLAFAIRNINVLLDCEIIISGYLAPFLTEDDISRLSRMVNQKSPFPSDTGILCRSQHGEMAPAAGAALAYISGFLNTI